MDQHQLRVVKDLSLLVDRMTSNNLHDSFFDHLQRYGPTKHSIEELETRLDAPHSLCITSEGAQQVIHVMIDILRFYIST